MCPDYINTLPMIQLRKLFKHLESKRTMKLLDKINPLKKKKEDFPHFDEKFGKPSGTAVPGPSADLDSPNSGFTPLPSAAPPPSNEKLDSIQRSVQLLTSTLEQLKRTMDSISQRMSTLEGGSNPQPTPPPDQQPRPVAAPVTPFNPQQQAQPPPIQPAPQPQPNYEQPQPVQQPEQQKKPVLDEEEEDRHRQRDEGHPPGWHSG